MSGSNSESMKQYLLDDSSSGDAPSADYLAYAGSHSDGDRLAKRKKYIVIAVVAVVGLAILIAIIGYAIAHKEEDDDKGGPNPPPPQSVPAVANQFRLPANVVPAFYDLLLRIDIDLQRPHFSGLVSITAAIRDTPMPAIVLHSLYLTIHSVNLSSSGSVIPASSYRFFTHQQVENGTQYLVIQAADGQAFNVTDSFVISVAFSRDLPTNTSSGLYGVNYTDGRNGPQLLAATQFEPVHSRRAFPNFDELQMKAVFQVTMETKQGLVALSNAPNISTEYIADGWQVSGRDTL